MTRELLESERAKVWNKMQDVRFGRVPNYLVANSRGIEPETVNWCIDVEFNRDLAKDISLYTFYKTLSRALNFAIENNLTIDHVKGYMYCQYNDPCENYISSKSKLKIA